jgi:hypothetical protein
MKFMGWKNVGITCHKPFRDGAWNSGLLLKKHVYADTNMIYLELYSFICICYNMYMELFGYPYIDVLVWMYLYICIDMYHECGMDFLK